MMEKPIMDCFCGTLTLSLHVLPIHISMSKRIFANRLDESETQGYLLISTYAHTRWHSVCVVIAQSYVETEVYIISTICSVYDQEN